MTGTDAIIVAAVASALGLMTWAARRELPHAEHETGTLLLRYSMALRWFGVFAAFGTTVLITLVVIFTPRQEGDTWAILTLYALAAAIGLPLWWESSRFYLRISSDGLERRSPWRERLFLPWSEVDELSYSAINSWFIVRGRENQRIRVNILVAGIPELLAECERRLPPAALKAAKRGYSRIGRDCPFKDRDAL